MSTIIDQQKNQHKNRLKYVSEKLMDIQTESIKEIYGIVTDHLNFHQNHAMLDRLYMMTYIDTVLRKVSEPVLLTIINVVINAPQID